MELLSYLKKKPVDYTYFAIGSCAHMWGEYLTEKEDQLLPLFFHNHIEKNPHDSFRAIHFDPAFIHNIENLNTYFTNLSFESVETPPLTCLQFWRSKKYNIEVILFKDSFNHPSPVYLGNDEWILETLAEQIVGDYKIQQKLVVQEFTGEGLLNLFRRIYSKSSNKRRFQNQILFDISYGVDTGCCTDMKTHMPFIDTMGNFYNLLILDHHELYKLIGVNNKMDTLIKKIAISAYKMILNSYHVDYRRRIRGEGVLFKSDIYDDTTSPDIIMEIIHNKLTTLSEILYQMNYIPDINYLRFNELFEKYYEYDVYKWYNEVDNLVPNDPHTQ